MNDERMSENRGRAGTEHQRTSRTMWPMWICLGIGLPPIVLVPVAPNADSRKCRRWEIDRRRG